MAAPSETPFCCATVAFTHFNRFRPIEKACKSVATLFNGEQQNSEPPKLKKCPFYMGFSRFCRSGDGPDMPDFYSGATEPFGCFQ
jgi:hypothetical protein